MQKDINNLVTQTSKLSLKTPQIDAKIKIMPELSAEEMPKVPQVPKLSTEE